MEIKLINENIKQKAQSLGFSACGIASSRILVQEEVHLREYLKNNFHGKMDYISRNLEKRLDPGLLVPGAKSIIIVLLNYYPEKILKGENIPFISKYAYGKDYHFVMKDKLKKLWDYVNSEIAPIKGRIFAGSAPVLEKAWAVQAGLGWIGKNGLLINKKLGSYFFIGELIIDLELVSDKPMVGQHCGNCTKCLKECPTNSFVQPFILDSRKCISYLTIEVDDDIPEEYREMFDNRIYGCDACQDVCPWNKDIEPHKISEFEPDNEFLKLDLDKLKKMDEDRFNLIFHQSPIERTGFKNFKRNIQFVFTD